MLRVRQIEGEALAALRVSALGTERDRDDSGAA